MDRLVPQRFYGRRKGHRLSAAQQQHMRHTLPSIVCDTAQLTRLGQQFPPDINTLALEIGFGAGEHLLAQAIANPQTGFLGIEIFENGIARLLTQIVLAGVTNIRLFVGNAHEALPHLPKAAFTKIYTLYPDPWPKRRHHKRRLITMPTIHILHDILMPNGWVYFASDDAVYVAWTLQHMQAHKGFVWTATQAAHWRLPPPGYTRTRYEAKAIKAGRVPTYLHFQKSSSCQDGPNVT